MDRIKMILCLIARPIQRQVLKMTSNILITIIITDWIRIMTVLMAIVLMVAIALMGSTVLTLIVYKTYKKGLIE